eukprot:m.1666 g.1666  ORF g.1666 m.1666 type:complete len:204 (+) comp2449_c0_seq1:40-651(+)
MASVVEQLFTAFHRHGLDVDLNQAVKLASDSFLKQTPHPSAQHPSQASQVNSAFAWQRHQPSSTSKPVGVSTDLYRGDGEQNKPVKTSLAPRQPTDLYRGGLGLESSVKKPSHFAPNPTTDPWQAETHDDVALKAADQRRTTSKATAWERVDDQVSIQQRQVRDKTIPDRTVARNPLLDGGDSDVLGGSKRRGQYNPRYQAFT